MTAEIENNAGLPDGWLHVDALDIDAQGVARKPDGKVVFIEGALPFEVVTANVNRKKNNWEQATLTVRFTANRRSACSRLPALWPARGRLRWLQDAAPACGAQVAVKQRVLEDNLWHLGKVKAQRAAAHRGAGLGLPLPGAAVGAPCAQEGRGAGGLSRAQEPLCGRHEACARCCRRM
jgi:hypothetical protein